MPNLRARLQASLGGKFRITRELTAGGMARVFLAEDLQLEREVVIKVVAPQFRDDTFLQRFQNEVLQTARLQHPTIVSIYDVGTLEDGGQRLPYYVMPYVRGESLRSRLKHEGSLSVSITVRILRSVLDALAHAHAHGVVHRDIKPENIFLSGSNAVLADFGVAKAVAGQPRGAGLTAPGAVIGTPTYMAPEQIAGDEATDSRADLYSLAIVAFEMLTGRLPWEASTTSEMLAAKARGSLASLGFVRADLPQPLAALIDRSLAWDPAKRPQSAEEWLRVLDGIVLTPTSPLLTTPGRRSPWTRKPLRVAGIAGAFAVLALGFLLLRPANLNGHTIRFAVLSPELSALTTMDTTLGHQLYHHLVRALYPIAGLELVDETEIARMEELGISTEEIVQKLRAVGCDSALVMETVAAGGGYRLQLALRHLKSAVRELIGTPIPLLTLERLSPDSTKALVGVLIDQVVAHFRLSSAAHTVRETRISDAATARTQGGDASSNRTPAGIRAAIGYYRQALRLDTTYAQAYADLADTYALALFYRYRSSSSPYEMTAEALRLAERAIALQPDLAEGYTARGYIGMVAGAPIRVIQENYSRAQRLHPENPNSRLWYVGLLAIQNNYAQALDTLRELARLDPANPGKRISIALYSLPSRNYADVVSNAAQAHALQPGFPFPSALQLWGLLLGGGNRMRECLNIGAGPFLGARAACLEQTRGRAAAQPVLDTLFRLLTSGAARDTVFDASLPASEMAMYAALHQEWEAARQWMIKSFEESPLGIEHRFLRSGLFNTELIRLGDSLREQSWQRVSEAARKADSLP